MPEQPRRKALKVFLSIVFTLSAFRQLPIALGQTKGVKSRKVAFEWSVPAAQVDIVRSNLIYEGREISQTDSRGLPLMVIFVGVTLLPYLANAILALHRQINYGGVIVDTRGETIKIIHDRALDGGTILVVGPDGTKIIERTDIVDPATLSAAMGKARAK